MPGYPLADRVVEVIADRGEATHPRYRYGSGCVVSGRTVLTAAHVVDGAVSVKVRDPGKILHEVSTVAVLPGGRVVSGGADRRVLVWDPMTQTELAQLNCSVNALSSGALSPGEVFLVVAHQDAGFSIWSVSGQEVTTSAFDQPSANPSPRY